MIASELGEAAVMDCPIDDLTKYEKENYVPLMEVLEDTFNCAGMCYTPKYLMFSDVSK